MPAIDCVSSTNPRQLDGGTRIDKKQANRKLIRMAHGLSKALGDSNLRKLYVND